MFFTRAIKITISPTVLMAVAFFSCSEGQAPKVVISQRALEFSSTGPLAAKPAFQWRAIAPSRSPSPGSCNASPERLAGCLESLRAEDGNILNYLACTDGGNNTMTEFGNPTQLEFDVADAASIEDATVTMKSTLGAPTKFKMSCIQKSGAERVIFDNSALKSFEFPEGTRTYTWDLPLDCFDSTNVKIKLTRQGNFCLGVDLFQLNVRSRYRSVPLDNVEGPTSCNPLQTCVDALNRDDGQYLKWIACSTSNTQTEFGTPTDFIFTVPDATRVTAAVFDLDSFAAGSNAVMKISCLTSSGPIVLSDGLDQSLPYAMTPNVRSFPVPVGTCFNQVGVAKIRVERAAGGANCLAADFVALRVLSDARPIPISEIPTVFPGTLREEGMRALNHEEGRFGHYLACSATGTNNTAGNEFPQTTVLNFQRPLPMTSAVFALRGVSTSSAQINVSCKSASGNIALGTVTFGTVAKTSVTILSNSCLELDPIQIELKRTNSPFCMSADYARLYDLSASAPSADLVINGSKLEGYADANSVAPGTRIRFKVSAPPAQIGYEIHRLSKTNTGALSTTLVRQGTSNVGIQNVPYDAYRKGPMWNTTFDWDVPSSTASGYYAVKLSQGTQTFWISFVVRSASATGDILILVPTLNAQAYNNWGGGSAYALSIQDGSWRKDPITAVKNAFNVGDPTLSVMSLRRPLNVDPAGNQGVGAELFVAGWFKDNVSRQQAFITDEDLHRNPDILLGYKVVVMHTHGEYWSPKMYDGLDKFLKSGTPSSPKSLLYLGGNSIYWQTELDSSASVMEVRKDHSNHIFGDRKSGGYFRQSASRPEANLLGVHYRDHLHTGAPFKLSSSGASHWLFAGTGLGAGQEFGKAGLGDYCGGAASGEEMDEVPTPEEVATYAIQMPAGLVKLARGKNGAYALKCAGNDSSEAADLVYYQHPAGGGVLSVGSMSFGGSLRIDAQLSKMIFNFLARF